MDGPLPAGMSRREFLVATGAASLLLYLDACTFGQPSGATGSVTLPPGSSPYEQALKLLHQAVLASPDHLVQRAADMVSAKETGAGALPRPCEPAWAPCASAPTCSPTC